MASDDAKPTLGLPYGSIIIDMKILIVHRLIAPFGGAHKYLHGLAVLLLAEGWDLHLAINRNKVTHEFVDSLCDMGVHVHYIEYDQSSQRTPGTDLDRIIAKSSPNVIDFETGAKSVRRVALTSEALRTSTAAKVFTMHLPVITDQSSIHSWRRFIPLSKDWKALAERREFVRLFDKGLSVSAYHAKNIAKLLRVDAHFFTVIPNGVDLEQYSPNTNTHHPGRVPRIIAIGTLTKQKRFDLLIRAADLMRGKGLEFEIVIAGEGVERSALENMIKNLDLGRCVKLVGHVNGIPSFLQGGDIYTMCSDSEGFPYSALEAMAAGLPMVVTNVGELPNMVEDGISGIVVKPGDSRALSKAISSLLMNTDVRCNVGKFARSRVEKNFDADLTWENVRKYYQSLSPSISQ